MNAAKPLELAERDFDKLNIKHCVNCAIQKYMLNCANMREKIMTDLFKWVGGRQCKEFYYERMKIYSFWRIDCYLIRWGAGSAVPDHKDEIKGYKHYRLNILLRGDKSRF